MAISPARARRERAALLKQIERDLRSKDRARLLALRQQIRAMIRARRDAVRRAIRECRERKRAIPTQKQAAVMIRDAKKSARASCDLELSAARRLSDPVERARAEHAAEAKHQRDLRRIERGLRAKPERPGVRAAERRSESDDEVRANIPPELATMFERVKRGIKGSDRKSRTEAFLEYVESHPDEQWEALEARTDDVIAELERRQAMPNPKKGKKRARRARRTSARPPKRWFDRCLRSVAAKRYARDPAAVCGAAWWRRPPAEREAIVRRLERGNRTERRTAVGIAKAEQQRADRRPPRRGNPGMNERQAIAEYERTHWGEKGQQRIRRGSAADPRHGTATELGELVQVVYRTKKRGDGLSEYEHFFEGPRPRLAYNAGGLLVVGGDYTVKKGGITG